MSESVPKLFMLVRHERQAPDQPLGVVAHVVEWSDGTCLLKWLTDPLSEERYGSMAALRTVRLSSNRCTLDPVEQDHGPSHD